MKKHFVYPLALVMAFCLVAGGCNSIRSSWNETKKFYKRNIEPTPSMELDVDNMGNDEEQYLARLVMPVDAPLQAMLKHLDGTDREPDAAWVQDTVQRFPWVGGVMVVDPMGYTELKYPSGDLKPLDIQAIIELGYKDADDGKTGESEQEAEITDVDGEEPKGEQVESQPWDSHKLMAMTQDTDLGPEVVVAYPFFEDNVWMGLVIVHFDPRSLLEYCPAPSDLAILTPGQVIADGDMGGSATGLAAEDWESMLDGNRYSGTWGDGSGKEYYWVARYLGDHHLIYAAEAKAVEFEGAE